MMYCKSLIFVRSWFRSFRVKTFDDFKMAKNIAIHAEKKSMMKVALLLLCTYM